MFEEFNPNPISKRVGDCCVRALCMALDDDWNHVYAGLCAEGYIQKDMPSANNVWGAYLRKHGFKRYPLPSDCPDCYTVKDFCKEHPHGIFILALNGHVLCIRNGNHCDTWDSGDEVPSYYWKKEH